MPEKKKRTNLPWWTNYAAGVVLPIVVVVLSLGLFAIVKMDNPTVLDYQVFYTDLEYAKGFNVSVLDAGQVTRIDLPEPLLRGSDLEVAPNCSEAWYIARNRNGYALMAINLDSFTAEGQYFPDYFSLITQPRISPDGTKVAVIAADTRRQPVDGTEGVVVYTLDGLEQIQQVANLHVDEIVWINDFTVGYRTDAGEYRSLDWDPEEEYRLQSAEITQAAFDAHNRHEQMTYSEFESLTNFRPMSNIVGTVIRCGEGQR